MGRSQRERGKRGERDAAAALSAALGISARRGVQYQGGEDSPDIATSIAGVHWEVKFVEREQVRSWMAQATDDAGDQVPVVVHRKSRAPWLVTVPLEKLHEFVTRLAQAIAQEVPAVGEEELSRSIPAPLVSPAAVQAAGHARVL